MAGMAEDPNTVGNNVSKIFVQVIRESCSPPPERRERWTKKKKSC
jgi:hypothetical protein